MSNPAVSPDMLRFDARMRFIQGARNRQYVCFLLYGCFSVPYVFLLFFMCVFFSCVFCPLLWAGNCVACVSLSNTHTH